MGSACLEVLAGEQTMKFQVLLCVLASTMSATLKQILPNYPYQGILPLAPYPYAFNPFSFRLAYPNNENPSTPKSSIPFPFYPFPHPFLLPQNGGYVHDSTGDVFLPYSHDKTGDSYLPYSHDPKGDGEKQEEKALPYVHDEEGDYQDDEDDIEEST